MPMRFGVHRCVDMALSRLDDRHGLGGIPGLELTRYRQWVTTGYSGDFTDHHQPDSELGELIEQHQHQRLA